MSNEYIYIYIYIYISHVCLCQLGYALFKDLFNNNL